ncbi:hypothetical protein [Streptomyces sp. NPDC020141]|uniref:hypothetical protein n=1 Tax=Streptomyces sp. NPDC020141 TaxID=3365065 RepID=UPI0037A6B97E
MKSLRNTRGELVPDSLAVEELRRAAADVPQPAGQLVVGHQVRASVGAGLGDLLGFDLQDAG